MSAQAPLLSTPDTPTHLALPSGSAPQQPLQGVSAGNNAASAPAPSLSPNANAAVALPGQQQQQHPQQPGLSLPSTPVVAAPPPPPATINPVHVKTEPMSNGVISPAALTTPALPSPTPPHIAPGPVAATGVVNQNGKRGLSPDRAGPPPKAIKANHGDDAKASAGSTPAVTPAATPAATTPAAPTGPDVKPALASESAPAAPASAPAAPAAAPAAPAEKEETEEERKIREKKEKDREEKRARERERARERKREKKEREAREKEAREKEEREKKEKEEAEKKEAKADDKEAVPAMQRGQGIDMRAEEEAQRRHVRSNVGGLKFAGSQSRGRQTDLIGEQALRTKCNQIASQHKMTVDDEAMRYLALAAEIRVRTLLASAIRAQQHRVNSTHQHKPPMSKPSPSGRPPQALWSQKITSDPHAVMMALANSNKEENKAHRVARTERNARETELARRAAAAQRDREQGRDGTATADTASSAGPASDAEAASAATPKPPKEPVFQANPTFGGPPPKKTGKGKKAASHNMSADVQAKITNATAAMLAGGRKRYAWETGAMGGAFRPSVPSLLSGKRKKGGEEDGEKEKKEEPVDKPAVEVAAPVDEAPKPPKRPKRTITGPHRRQVDIETVGDKKGRDDTALTVVDVLFALEHEGNGHGPGSTDDITRRFWTRPGGPYGKW